MRLPVNRFAPLAALVFLSACVGGGDGPTREIAPGPRTGPAADYPMVIGAPFVVDGKTYTPVDTMNSDAVGYANTGAEGEAGISAAHRTLPLPSYVEVTALDSGRTILVRLERRGPMTGSRLIELSPGAATQLGITGQDRAAVRVRRVNPPEVERALLRGGQTAPARMNTPKSLLAVLIRKLDQQDGVAASAPKVLPGTEPSPVPAVPAPKPTSDPKPAPKPAAASTPRPAAQAGSLVIQVAAFSTRERAAAAAAKLGGRVSPAGQLWRVLMGPYAAQGEAAAALAKAKAAGYSDARIQRAG